MIHVDTSFFLRALVLGSPEDRALRRWILGGTPLAMSTPAWTEFLCGPLEAGELAAAASIIDRRREYTTEHAETAAWLFNSSGRRRGSLIDCMIAAVAMADDAPLATANVADFRRLERFGLQLVLMPLSEGQDPAGPN